MNQYIQPLTKIYTSLAEARGDVDTYGHSFLFDDRKIPGILDLAQGSRNLIVGEPGVGKTELLNKFKEHHESLKDKTLLVNLRIGNPIEQIDKFIKVASKKRKVLILDALDEVRSAIFPDVLQKIETISRENPDVVIYLSSRWIFISKFSTSFPEYRFIRIMPFSAGQVRDYLIQAGNAEIDVDALLARIYRQGRVVLQIPRYLSFLLEYIKEKTIGNVSQVSRNELFEYFIYSKLNVEDKKLNTDSKSVIKRILEKLALTMEIYQTNIITKDELMTFFDDIESDLKLTVLSHITLEVFCAKTVLQESSQDLDSLEFENAEFQEYLAAKEITRFAEPHRVAFSFAADENLEEILPSWFNTFSFLVDMSPDMLEQALEFSGLRSGKFKIADEGFLNFLARVNPKNISQDFRARIFMDVIAYYEKTKQWLLGELASALPGFYSPGLEINLKSLVERAEEETGANRYVPLGNIAYAVAYLLESKASLDKPYWRKKLISYTQDKNENGVLQRHALLALEKLQDPSVIDELSDLSSENDELVSREFISMCVSLNADHPKSLAYAIASVRKNDLSGRYGLFKLKEKGSVITFLKTFIEDDKFRKEFLDDTAIFGDQDSVLAVNIEQVLDTEIEELCKVAIIKSVQNHIYRSIDKSSFVSGLFQLLKRKYPGFVSEIIQRINDSDKGASALYFAQDILAQVLEKEDIPSFLDVMIALDQKRTALDTMIKIKYSKRDSAEEIYEAGRSKLSTEYASWESIQKKDVPSVDTARAKRALEEFRTSLEPLPGQFTLGVFGHYVHSADTLDPLLEEKDRSRLIELIKGSVLNQNPAKFGLTIQSQHNDGNGGTKTYTSSQIAHIFGDALLAAQRLGVNIEPFRSNIALHIPFAHDNELKATFEMIENFTSAELDPVIAIYREKNTDLWKHQPESFVDLVQKYHLIEAVPILNDFVKESGFRSHVRKEALRVSESIIPNALFLQEIFDLYKESEREDEKEIAYTANGLLITAHGKSEAVVWRIEEIKKRTFSFIMPRSGQAHNVSPSENELRHDRPFAKPLSDLKHPGFEEKYLDLLDSAIKVWSRGKEFYLYAQYMWDIVFAYFENLKEYRTYGPLKLLEKRIASLKDQDGANWLYSKIVGIRRSYLTYLGKPKNFSEAIRKYNEARTFSDRNIRTSADLFHHLQDIIATDLRRWVENEGAYNIIVSKKKYKENNEYEKLVQMTIKSELSNICRGRGFSFDIAREVQLISSKRTDFIVRYGFVGPIVLEVKLASSSDLQKIKLEESESYLSMDNYMKGYGASHGIFLIMDDTGKKHASRAEEVFSRIPNVLPMTLDCYTPANSSKKKTNKKKPVKSTRSVRKVTIRASKKPKTPGRF